MANYNLAGIQIVFAEIFEMLREYEISFSISLLQLTKKNAGESVNVPGGTDNCNGDAVKHDGGDDPLNSSNSSSSGSVPMEGSSTALESKVQVPVPAPPDESVSSADYTLHATHTNTHLDGHQSF
jgi:hypothetical protein